MTHSAWMRAYAQRIDDKPVRCPECGDAEVALCFVGDPETRLGFARIWCPRRLRGIQISRVEVPARFAIIAYDDVDTMRVECPEIELVP